MLQALTLFAQGMYTDQSGAIGSGYSGMGIGMDYYYILLVIPAMLIALFAQAKVKSAYKKYAQVGNSRNLTGAQAARMILDSHGLTYVPINVVQGELTDHFNPTDNTVNLSPDVYNGTSVASIGIASHEVGHAIQHAEGYFPNKLRAAIIPVTNFGSQVSMILILIGLVMSSFVWLAWLGVILYSTATLFQLVTLPVEFNASNRALKHIKELGIAGDDDYKGVKKVLSAAAMTYVAALITSLASFLRLLLIVRGSDSRCRR